MAASSNMFDKQEDNCSTQTRTNGRRKTTRLTPTNPRRSPPPTWRFQELTKQVISTSAFRKPSTGMHSNAPSLSSSEARSSNSGKVRRHSSSNVIIACANDIDANRQSLHNATRSPNTDKDCQNSASTGAADDVNRLYSHRVASSSATSQYGGHSRYISSDSKPQYGSSLPASPRISRPCMSPSNHAFSHLPSSCNIVNHGSSHPTSSRNDLMSHGSLKSVASGNLANTSSNLSDSTRAAATPNGIARRVVGTHTKSHAGIGGPATKDRTNELCKHCKATLMESVCFIGNDGRISAALTGHAYGRHSHHCNVKGCAANRSYYQSPSPLSKKDSLSKRQAPIKPQLTRRKSHTLSRIGDCQSTASSVQGDDRSKQEVELSLSGSVEMSSSTRSETRDKKQELDIKETSDKSFAIKWCEGDEIHADTDSLCQTTTDLHGLDAFSPGKDREQPPLTEIPKDQLSCEEISHAESVEVQSPPAPSCVSFDIHDDYDDDDDEKVSVNGDDIQELKDFKSLFYHGDNEYSCSEDGTEATTATPNSLIKGAFDDLSNIDIEQSNCENGTSRSTMARMRQKYLESLREQEAETVRLRKQEIMARKQAGDWMLDCHMEEVLHRLAPNGDARVKVLVEAYETVIHHSDSESSQTAHHQDQEHLENLHSCASS